VLRTLSRIRGWSTRVTVRKEIFIDREMLSREMHTGVQKPGAPLSLE
jgi:hypothetical protein